MAGLDRRRYRGDDDHLGGRRDGRAVAPRARVSPPPLALALSAFDIAVFAMLVGAAIYLRRQPDWHKRLMLSATILLLGAPMFRFVIHYVGIKNMSEASIASTLAVDAFSCHV